MTHRLTLNRVSLGSLVLAMLKPRTTVFCLLLLFGCSPGAPSNGDTGDAASLESDTDASPSADAGLDAPSVDEDVQTDPASDSDGDILEELYAPHSPGPFAVGFRVMETSYLDPSDGTERTIPISVWYPTEASSGTAAFYQNLVERQDVFEDAPLAETGRDLPVLLFSHGNGSLPEQSFFMTEHWATHGWLVAAPEHIGNSVFDGLDDEPQSMYRRPLDIRATLDALESLPDSDPLSGQLSNDVVVSGHSFGGYTTLAVAGAGFDTTGVDCDGGIQGLLMRLFCEIQNDALDSLLEAGFADPRVDVAIPQTPGGALFFAGNAGEDGLGRVGIPTLLMTGALDQALPDAEEGAPIWESLVGSGHMRFHLLDGGHFTFSNMCALLPALAAGDGCGPEFIAPEIALELINGYSLSFARMHLWGDERAAEFLSADPSYQELELSVR